MQCKCSKCGGEFNDKVGMSPMQSNLAIRVRNRVGNICSDCREEMAKTKKGRRHLFFYDAKIALRCMLFLLPVFLIFAGLTVCLAFFVL